MHGPRGIIECFRIRQVAQMLLSVHSPIMLLSLLLQTCLRLPSLTLNLPSQTSVLLAAFYVFAVHSLTSFLGLSNAALGMTLQPPTPPPKLQLFLSGRRLVNQPLKYSTALVEMASCPVLALHPPQMAVTQQLPLATLIPKITT
jgi:hypothetical protein